MFFADTSKFAVSGSDAVQSESVHGSLDSDHGAKEYLPYLVGRHPASQKEVIGTISVPHQKRFTRTMQYTAAGERTRGVVWEETE